MPKNKLWFRVYNRLIDSPDIIDLDDNEFRVLIGIWCLASASGDRDGIIKYSQKGLQRRLNYQRSYKTFATTLQSLCNLGLIQINGIEIKPSNWQRHQHDYESKMPINRDISEKKGSEREQKGKSMGSEREQKGKLYIDIEVDKEVEVNKNKEKEKKKEKEISLPGGNSSARADRIPYSEIFEAWNLNTEKPLPKCSDTKERRRAIKSIWDSAPEFQSVNVWVQVFKWFNANDFLSGRSGEWMAGSIDTCLRKSKFPNYFDKSKGFKETTLEESLAKIFTPEQMAKMAENDPTFRMPNQNKDFIDGDYELL